MRLVSLNCPKCGGELEIEEGGHTALCGYCGSYWYIEDGQLNIKDNHESRPKRKYRRLLLKVRIVNPRIESPQLPHVSSTPAQIRNNTQTNYNQQRDKQANEDSVGDIFAYLIILLIMILFGSFSYMDHSGSMPVLGSMIMAPMASFIAIGAALKSHAVRWQRMDIGSSSRQIMSG